MMAARPGCICLNAKRQCDFCMKVGSTDMVYLLKRLLMIAMGLCLLGFPVYAQEQDSWQPQTQGLSLLNPGVTIKDEIDKAFKQTEAALNRDVPALLQQTVLPARGNLKVLNRKVTQVLTDTAKEQALVAYLNKYRLPTPETPSVAPLDSTSNPEVNILIIETNQLMTKLHTLTSPVQHSRKWLELSKQDFPLVSSNPITLAGLTLINMASLQLSLYTVPITERLAMDIGRIQSNVQQIQSRIALERDRDPMRATALGADLNTLTQVTIHLESASKTVKDANLILTEGATKSGVLLKHLAQ